MGENSYYSESEVTRNRGSTIVRIEELRNCEEQLWGTEEGNKNKWDWGQLSTQAGLIQGFQAPKVPSGGFQLSQKSWKNTGSCVKSGEGANFLA